MKQTKLFVATLFVLLGLGANLPSVYAQDNPNTITFDNKSGEPALVKLIGPTGQTVEVPNGQRKTVNVATGEYYILARYGRSPEQYRYSKGDPFTVTQTATQYSAITITLHKVIGGNYPSHPASAEEFEKAGGLPGKEAGRPPGSLKEVESADFVGAIDEVRFGLGSTRYGQDSTQQFLRVKVKFRKPEKLYEISEVKLVSKSGQTYSLVAVRNINDLPDDMVVWSRMEDVCRFKLLVGTTLFNAKGECVGWGLDDNVILASDKLVSGGGLLLLGEAELRLLFVTPRTEVFEILQLKVNGRSGTVLLSRQGQLRQ